MSEVASPDLDSYSALYKNREVFEKLFPYYETAVEEAAEIIWQQVFKALRKPGGLPAVDRVVDVGCGDGAVLKALQKRAAETEELKDLKFVGVDPAAPEETQRNLKLIPARAEEYLKELQEESERCRRRTALLVLGHTWFHLDQEDTLDLIHAVGPGLIVVDVHRRWDRALGKLSSGKDEILESVREWGEDDHAALFTKKDGNDHVERGIRTLRDSRLIFSTKQAGRPTSSLFGATAVCGLETDPPGSRLAQNANEGALTGPRAKSQGFIVRRQFRHTTAWGEMDAWVLVIRDPIARLVNQAYFDTVRELVRDQIDQLGWPARPLNHGDDCNHHPPLAALAILPFDLNTTFSRFFTPGRVADEPIADVPLVVAGLHESQHRIPTAYALFHAIQDHVSRPIGFPVNHMTDRELLPVDKLFRDLERELLPGDNKAHVIMPVFYGTLPIVAFAFPVPPELDVARSSVALFHAAVSSAAEQFVASIKSRGIGEALLRPFVTQAVKMLWGCFPTADDPARESLDTLEALLGADHEDGTGAARPNPSGVLQRDWRSWVESVPSEPIRNSPLAIARTRDILRAWHAERNHALSDPPTRISTWLQTQQFFGTDGANRGHGVWDAAVHGMRLAALLEVELPALNNVDLAGNAALKKALMGIEGHWLSTWARSMLGKMATGQSADSAYASVKAVLCRCEANRLPEYRFGVERLRLLLSAAMPDVALQVTTQWGESEYWTEGCEHRRVIPGDPSFELAEFGSRLRARTDTGGVAEVVLSTTAEHTDTLLVNVTFTCSAAAPGGEGADKAWLNEPLRKVKFEPKWNGKSLTLQFRVRPGKEPVELLAK